MHTECSVGREIKAVLIGGKCRREVCQRTGSRDSICDEGYLRTIIWGRYATLLVCSIRHRQFCSYLVKYDHDPKGQVKSVHLFAMYSCSVHQEVEEVVSH
jgi:hypothetical protein